MAVGRVPDLRQLLLRIPLPSSSTALFDAVVERLEEAILDALLAARTARGRDAVAYAPEPELLVETLRRLRP